MKKLFLRLSLALCSIVFVFGSIQTLSAQEDGTDAFILEEITVTAQKRSENLQKVSITMESIAGDKLTKYGKSTLDDVLSGISSVIVNQNGDEFNVSIRGMDNDNPAGASLPMVAVTVDGTYSNSTGLGSAGIYDMQRVEVLSGPQGTLYSRNAGGGVINLISNDPKDEYEGSASIGIGNYSLLSTQGMVNAPLTDKLALRAAFSTVTRDGYISNGTDDNDAKSARVKVKYTPSEDMTILFGVEANHTAGKGRGDGVEIFEDDQPDDAWVSDLPGDLYSNSNKNTKYYLNMNWDLPIGTLTFLPSYSEGYIYKTSPSENETTGVISTSRSYTDEDEVSAEMRLASPEESFLKWLVGLYYYNRELDQLDTGSNYSHKTTSNPSKAIFGNLSYPVADDVRLIFGGRYTMDDDDTTTLNIMNGNEDYSAYSTESKHFDYKVGVEYDLSEDSMLYADYSTGFRKGMRGDKDETLKSYQVGSKNQFLDNKLQLNLSAYYYDYKDYQVNEPATYTDENGDETQVFGSGNGKADIYGLDLSSDYVLSSKDRLNLSASYLHAEISDLTITYDSYLPDKTAYEGQELNNSPEFTISASYEHMFLLDSGASIAASLNTTYRTEAKVAFMVEDNQIPDGMSKEKVNREPAHFTSGASINYASADGNWDINAYIKNIENYAQKDGFMMGSMRISAPRTIGAVLSIRF